MVFQPASILTNITGELYSQLKSNTPALHIWTVVQQADALQTHFQVLFCYQVPAFGYFDLFCRPAEYSLQNRHVLGKCYGHLDHQQLNPDIKFQQLQQILSDIREERKCVIQFHTTLTTLRPTLCENCEPYKVTTSFEELNYQFNIDNNTHEYSQFAHELTQDALTWITHITPLLRPNHLPTEDT